MHLNYSFNNNKNYYFKTTETHFKVVFKEKGILNKLKTSVFKFFLCFNKMFLGWYIYKINAIPFPHQNLNHIYKIPNQ